MNRVLTATIIALSALSQAQADQVLQEFTWDNDVLRVTNDSGQTLTNSILEIEAPPITGALYALTGRVKYEDVEGVGYIEMWSHFGTRGAFFSRTLMDHGPMQSLSGTSDWREFHLPFLRGPDVPPPDRLVINVVLPGRGTVYLSPLKLVEPNSGTVSAAWISRRQAGWLGGALGTLFGGAGTLIGVLASRGRARRVVLASIDAFLVLGALFLLAGLLAAGTGQAFHVFMLPLTLGAIFVIVTAVNRNPIRRQYEQRELRRMESLDS